MEQNYDNMITSSPDHSMTSSPSNMMTSSPSNMTTSSPSIMMTSPSNMTTSPSNMTTSPSNMTTSPSNMTTSSPSRNMTTSPKKPVQAEVDENTPLYNTSQPKVWEFDSPNPWDKIIYKEGAEYPYSFFIKLKIPGLQDYQTWKEIIPNIDFNPLTRLVVIPSKDEASALAVANLMAINFAGMMKLEDILDKNLIQISISKAKSHEVVQTKLREQIMDTLYGKSNGYKETPQLGNTNNIVEKRQLDPMGTRNPNQASSERVNFQNEGFRDTFEHFSANTTAGGIDAFEGNYYFSNL